MVLVDLKNKIYQDINESNLPIDAIYYVVKDVMNDVINAYNRQLETEEEERAEAASKAEQDAVKEEPDAAAAQVKEKEEK